MAESNFTAPTPRIHQRVDNIEDLLAAASAIVDCVRILTSLERAPNRAVANTLALGEGFAGGDTALDTSMPVALHHAIKLMDDARLLVGAAT